MVNPFTLDTAARHDTVKRAEYFMFVVLLFCCDCCKFFVYDEVEEDIVVGSIARACSYVL